MKFSLKLEKNSPWHGVLWIKASINESSKTGNAGLQIWEGEIPSFVSVASSLISNHPLFLVNSAWLSSFCILSGLSSSLSQTGEAQKSFSIPCPPLQQQRCENPGDFRKKQVKISPFIWGKKWNKKTVWFLGFFLKRKWTFEFEVLKAEGTWEKKRSVGGFGWAFLERQLDWKPQIAPTFPAGCADRTSPSIEANVLSLN